MTFQELRAVVDAALAATNFWIVGAGRTLSEHRPLEEIRWELFRGHLLDPSQTRETRPMESWEVRFRDAAADGAADAPLIAVRWDQELGRLYVVRALHVHGWEAYESSPGVIASRPALKWMQELVGAIDLDRFGLACVADSRWIAVRSTTIPLPVLEGELARLLELAVFGASRLPITSPEAPLPAFSLGRLAYVGGTLESGFAPPTLDELPRLVERPRWLEFLLRGADVAELPPVVRRWTARLQGDAATTDALLGCLLGVFNDSSLTPYTGFAANLIELVRLLGAPESLGPRRLTPLVATMLRLLTRHLTAFDLRRFHSLGANYPDALVLDALLRLLLEFCEQAPAAALAAPTDDPATSQQKLVVRRALRQAWIVRKQYEQLRVPDAPTSMGENQRVLPEPFFRVPEEQIVRPDLRSKILFADSPAERLWSEATTPIWNACLADLVAPRELQELGMALYLDRPLGLFKAPGEVDRTPLLSYEAFSRSLAAGRLDDLAGWGCLQDASRLAALRETLARLAPIGVAANRLPADERTGVVALSDARKAAGDFVFTSSTRRSLSEFLISSRIDLDLPDALRAAIADRRVGRLLIRTATADDVLQGRPLLTLFDADGQTRGEIFPRDATRRPPVLAERDGVEYFRDGYVVRT